MSQRKVDRVAELGPGKRTIKYPEPVPPEAYKDNGTGPGRLPDGETVKGPEYEAAMEREAKARLCIVCGERERRTRFALRCEVCEQRHLEAVRLAQARRKQGK